METPFFTFSELGCEIVKKWGQNGKDKRSAITKLNTDAETLAVLCYIANLVNEGLAPLRRENAKFWTQQESIRAASVQIYFDYIDFLRQLLPAECQPLLRRLHWRFRQHKWHDIPIWRETDLLQLRIGKWTKAHLLFLPLVGPKTADKFLEHRKGFGGWSFDKWEKENQKKGKERKHNAEKAKGDDSRTKGVHGRNA